MTKYLITFVLLTNVIFAKATIPTCIAQNNTLIIIDEDFSKDRRNIIKVLVESVFNKTIQYIVIDNKVMVITNLILSEERKSDLETYLYKSFSKNTTEFKSNCNVG